MLVVDHLWRKNAPKQPVRRRYCSLFLSVSHTSVPVPSRLRSSPLIAYSALLEYSKTVSCSVSANCRATAMKTSIDGVAPCDLLSLLVSWSESCGRKHIIASGPLDITSFKALVPCYVGHVNITYPVKPCCPRSGAHCNLKNCPQLSKSKLY